MVSKVRKNIEINNIVAPSLHNGIVFINKKYYLCAHSYMLLE